MASSPGEIPSTSPKALCPTQGPASIRLLASIGLLTLLMELISFLSEGIIPESVPAVLSNKQSVLQEMIPV